MKALVHALAAGVRAYRSLLLVLAALTALTTAAWITWGLAAGLVGIGLGLALIEFLTGDEDPSP